MNIFYLFTVNIFKYINIFHIPAQGDSMHFMSHPFGEIQIQRQNLPNTVAVEVQEDPRLGVPRMEPVQPTQQKQYTTPHSAITSSLQSGLQVQ